MYVTKHPISAIDEGRNDVYNSLSAKLDTSKITSSNKESLVMAFNSHGDLVLKIEEDIYKTIAAYDEAQRKLPADRKDGAANAYVTKKLIKLVAEKGTNGKAVIKESLEHDIPKIMFVVLPIFAWFIGLFYNGRKYFYSQHAIFSLHYHSLMFLSFLVLCLVGLFNILLNSWSMVFGLLEVMLFIYLVIALRYAYQESIWRSVYKAIGISLLYATLLAIINIIVVGVVFVLI